MSEFQQLKKIRNHIGPTAGVEPTSNMIPWNFTRNQKFLSGLNVKLYTCLSELRLGTVEGAVNSVLRITKVGCADMNIRLFLNLNSDLYILLQT